MATSTNHLHLAIDMGNSAAKAAVFREGEMIGPVIRFTNQEWEVADRLVTNHGVKNIIYSTVANVLPPQWMDKWKNEERLVLPLGPAIPLPFSSEYETMETLGQDRIAAVAGSFALPTTLAPASAPVNSMLSHSNAARLIVDAGTCATLDLVDDRGVYLGGNISPGIRMRLQAMHAFTAKLPELEPAATRGRVGQTTAQALRHGAQMGLVYEIEGLFQRLVEEFPGICLLLTGGDAAWLATQLRVPFTIHPHLVLQGLNQILSNYVENES